MKKTILTLLFAMPLLAMMSADASAWYCRADSRAAYGWGTSGSRSQAARIALRQCAIRTPRRQTCYLTSCR